MYGCVVWVQKRPSGLQWPIIKPIDITYYINIGNGAIPCLRIHIARAEADHKLYASLVTPASELTLLYHRYWKVPSDI